MRASVNEVYRAFSRASGAGKRRTQESTGEALSHAAPVASAAKWPARPRWHGIHPMLWYGCL